MPDQDRLKKYIEKLETLGKGLPSKETLRKLQVEFALTTEDLKKLGMLVERHKDRADIHRQRDNLNGAIEELERSTQLTPRDASLHLELAKLYKNRYENYGFLQRDRETAEKEARRTLSLDSSLKEADQLINEMDLLHGTLHNIKDRKRPLIIIILLIICLLVVLSHRERIMDWIYRTLNPPVEVNYTPPPKTFDPSEVKDVPLQSFDFAEKNIKLTLVKSEIAPLNDHWGYTLQGGITSLNQAVGKAELNLRFLDKERKLLHEQSVIINRENGLLVLPHQTLPIDFFFYLPISPEEVAQITITPQSIELLNPPSYDKRDVKIWWDVNKPEGVKLTLKERESSSFEGYDRSLNKYIFDLDQGGTEIITQLKLSLRWKNDREETLYSQEIFPIKPESTPLLALEKRALEFFIQSDLDEDWEKLHYDIWVTHIELKN